MFLLLIFQEISVFIRWFFFSISSYPEIVTGVENDASPNVGHIPDEVMSVASSTDDSVAAAAVFRHLGNNYIIQLGKCVRTKFFLQEFTKKKKKTHTLSFGFIQVNPLRIWCGVCGQTQLPETLHSYFRQKYDTFYTRLFQT